MTRAYDMRPNLETYDALTMRGLAKFALLAACLVGASVLAEQFEFERWFRASIQLLAIAIGLRATWIGYKALMFGMPLPDHASGPRYAEDRATFISPRRAAVGEIVGGSIFAAFAAFETYHILSE